MGKAFDFKKEYKDLYMPKSEPALIQVPSMSFIMVDGEGDPDQNPWFEQAIGLLYGLSYTIKMNKQGLGYFGYVVPPLEGLWWVDGGEFAIHQRENWRWTLMIRQPEFVDAEVFAQASEVAQRKKGLDPTKARLEAFHEGQCVQIMHIGPYATEPESMAKMHAFIAQEGLKCSGGRHHEIYLSDPKKTSPEKQKTILRLPVKA